MQLFAETDLVQPSRLSEGTAAMLAALADIGCSKHVIAALLSFGDDVHPDHIRFLTGPVVQHASPWAELTPAWLYQAAIADRVRIVTDEHARRTVGWQVGPTELTAVMYPATMDAPMQRDYADIYLWASAQASARHHDKTVAEIWSAIGEPVEDRAVMDPAGRYHHLPAALRRNQAPRRQGCRCGRTPSLPLEKSPAVAREQLPLF